MDGISHEFETWPDRIICLRRVSLIVIKKQQQQKKQQQSIFDFILDFIISIFSFDRIILKLADKVDMDEVLDKFENCPDQIIRLF